MLLSGRQLAPRPATAGARNGGGAARALALLPRSIRCHRIERAATKARNPQVARAGRRRPEPSSDGGCRWRREWHGHAAWSRPRSCRSPNSATRATGAAWWPEGQWWRSQKWRGAPGVGPEGRDGRRGGRGARGVGRRRGLASQQRRPPAVARSRSRWWPRSRGERSVRRTRVRESAGGDLQGRGGRWRRCAGRGCRRRRQGPAFQQRQPPAVARSRSKRWLRLRGKQATAHLGSRVAKLRALDPAAGTVPSEGRATSRSAGRLSIRPRQAPRGAAWPKRGRRQAAKRRARVHRARWTASRGGSIRRI